MTPTNHRPTAARHACGLAAEVLAAAAGDGRRVDVSELLERLTPEDRRRSDFDEMSVGRRYFEVTRDGAGAIVGVKRVCPSSVRFDEPGSEG